MSITVEFKDFEEMKEFARVLLGGQSQMTDVQVSQSPASIAPAPITAYSMTQTGQAPVQPPMQPVQTNLAPVQQAPTNQAPTAPMTQQASIQQPVNSVPTTTQNYTLDDLARAAMPLMDSGRQGELLQLLATFGVDALPALPPAQFGAFATALRGMGAQI